MVHYALLYVYPTVLILILHSYLYRAVPVCVFVAPNAPIYTAFTGMCVCCSKCPYIYRIYRYVGLLLQRPLVNLQCLQYL
jgi:hypothetical protein